MIEVIGVDVDDTLCLTEEAAFAIENEALQRIGRPPMSRELHIATWGHVLAHAIQERSPGVDVEMFHEAYHPVIQEFLADGRLDKIPEENYAALDKLIGMGKTIVLLTSRTYSELQHMLDKAHPITERASKFYYKETMEHQKPDPRAFTELLADHEIHPDRCVYVGDSVGDAHASTGAGVHFVASLESGIRQPKDFREYNVASFITKFPQIVDAVIDIDARLQTHNA